MLPSIANKVPVAFIVFNRPAHTIRTFDAIREYKPPVLCLIADGPRSNNTQDIDLCRQVLSIVDIIDWPCIVHKNFSPVNLGCRLRVSSGLDWTFNLVDHAIIIEDDCLASPRFFEFCESLLSFYRDNENVWVINGNSYQASRQWGDGSYFFSKYPDCWGWATWRRAWSKYDPNMSFLNSLLSSKKWIDIFPSLLERSYFERCFYAALSQRLNTWDHQWTACVLNAGAFCATPNGNLVTNIGFDKLATHTSSQGTNPHHYKDSGPLAHPSVLAIDHTADAQYAKSYIIPATPIAKFFAFIRAFGSSAKLRRLLRSYPK